MRPGTLALFLTLAAALAAQTVVLEIEAPPSAPFDFRQGRDWQKYLQGTKPRVLPQPKPKQLRADAGSCFTMRIVPVQPDIDPGIARKAPDVDPRMVIKTPPPCEQSGASPAQERKFLLRKP